MTQMTDLELPPDAPTRITVDVSQSELVDAARRLFDAGYRLALVAAHDGAGPMRVVYLFTAGPPDRRVELVVAVDRSSPAVPSLASLSFPASRFEREMRDMFGIEPIGHLMPRRLVLHQHWPEGWHPMRRDAGPRPPWVENAEPYPFVPVEGAGIYEIPVGPVHAGLIEPGHFRFFVVGETIVKMKSRLWFVHKGIEKLMEGRDLRSGLALAERISGDSAVGHGLACCLAVEDACGIEVPPRAAELRAVLLELERVVSHVTDIGALCNDVGFGLVNARALTLRERILRIHAEVTGHRLLRGGIVPGGVQLQRLPTPDELEEIGERLEDLVDLARTNSIVMDRFSGTAVLGAEDARAIGVLGVVARGSGLAVDARVEHPMVAPPPGFRVALRDRGGAVARDDAALDAGARGDVLARFDVRVEEARISLAWLAAVTERDGPLTAIGSTHAVLDRHGAAAGIRHGSGIVEGWRGSIVHRVEIDAEGVLRRVRIVDPSFVTWPALAIALADTIVPDFPLANKSFNLSYAGNDL